MTNRARVTARDAWVEWRLRTTDHAGLPEGKDIHFNSTYEMILLIIVNSSTGTTPAKSLLPHEGACMETRSSRSHTGES